MKLLCVILATLIMLLSVQPPCIATVRDTECADNCCSGEQSNDCKHDINSKDCNKSCNPFQICGCCAFAALIPMQVDIAYAKPILFFRQYSTGSTPGITPAEIGKCWQPPRVA